MEQFEAYFLRADADRDGRISGNEAVAFFQATNLPKQVLAQIWNYADQKRTGFLGRPEFYNALKLVTVAQSKRDLTPEIVKAALYGPASSKIPSPQINLSVAPGLLNMNASSVQISGSLTSTQNIRASGPHGFLPQQSQSVTPPRPPIPVSGFTSQMSVSGQVMPGTGLLSVPQPRSYSTLPGRHDGFQGGVSSQVSTRSLSPAIQGGSGPLVSPVTQNKSTEFTGSSQSASAKPSDVVPLDSMDGKEEGKSMSAKGNGFSPDSVFGDVFTATPSQSKNSVAQAYSAGSLSTSATVSSISFKEQPPLRSNAASQAPSIEARQFQSPGKPSPNVLAPNSAVTSVPDGNVVSAQSQHPWPRMTQSDVQKYNKVFVQVDTDRDGKITGEQARNLFLSWKLPREILKQVWDLSDLDNDSMLSLREFCIALYLMERYREGCPLPAVLPSPIIMFDGVSLPAFGQPVAGFGNTFWRPPSGPVQPQGTKNARSITSVGGGKPPHPAPVPQPDDPVQQKATVPVLEKHLVDQLSSEEQDSLNKKFEEAKASEKKVSNLEKDISEAKQKIQFYHAKMQELILYKSRCDNRLNEITEKVVADKREAESLAKKYEEKYKQVGDVASKLTIEEATFRDIQEKKMELYRAILKLEQENSDDVQEHANKIQSDLEELVKALNERCKTYGLRGKPTSLVELPFGWQPGIGGAAADWDETWDKFEEEGFSYVKELTLDVQNVTAPPQPKSSLIRERTNLDNGNIVSQPSEVDEESEASNKLTENEMPHDQSTEQIARSPLDSPSGSDAVESASKVLRPVRTKDITVNGSIHEFDIPSGLGGAESVLSVDKGFDEPRWGSFDTHYDRDAAWDFNPSTPKDAELERHSESSLFDANDWGLNPIKTGLKGINATFSKQGPFFDSVPSTPADYASSSEPKMGPFFNSVPSTPLYNANGSQPKMSPFFDSVPSTPLHNSSGSPNANSMFMSSSLFADSVPSTPMYNTGTSPRKFAEGSEDQYSFDSFSRFDSFNMQDSGPFSSRESLSRFDSMRSTRDSEFDQGYFGRQESLARFDSFRSTADSDYNFGGPFPPQSAFTRFDSTSSTRDSDYGHGFPSFDDAADPFGSGEPFRTAAHEAAQTPRKDSDSWKVF